MTPSLSGIIFATVLFVGILGLVITGRRIGLRRLSQEGQTAEKGFGALEGAVFGLMGLVLAFLFSGALTRFEGRRQLMIEEANAIGTAWLRVDLLPQEAQPAMRGLFRNYLDQRIGAFESVPDMEAVKKAVQQAGKTQVEIWRLALSSAQQTASAAAPMLLLPALNDMFDIATAQNEVVRFHPPQVTFLMLGALTFACSLFAGYDLASRPKLDLLHTLAFAAVFSVTMYVIIDLEYPRLGLITMRDSDQVLHNLRKGME